MRLAAKLSLAVIIGLLGFGFAGNAEALDCSLVVLGSSCTIQGATFSNGVDTTVGTGLIDPFVRLQTNQNIETGYNTSGRPLQFDELNPLNFTHDLLIAQIPIVNCGATTCYEFLLDINQTGSDPLLSLFELQVFTTSSAGLNNATGPDANGNISFAAATQIYNLDVGAQGDSVVQLNYNLNAGSGNGFDMLFLLPTSLVTSGDRLILYSAFGIPNNNNDGFEEWATRNPTGSTVVAQPASLMLLGFGLTAMSLATARVARKRHSKK